MSSGTYWRLLSLDGDSFTVLYECRTRPECERVFHLLRSLCPDKNISMVMRIGGI